MVNLEITIHYQLLQAQSSYEDGHDRRFIIVAGRLEST